MPMQAVIGTLAVYALLALLLLSLNIFSLWRWWVKAAAIILTGAAGVFAYVTITAMIGWPTFTELPKRFNLVATRTIDPDIANGAPGHVYMWVEELNANNVAVGAPRAYEVPYTAQLASDAQAAQNRINTGEQVMGEKKEAGNQEGGTAPGQFGKPGQQSTQTTANKTGGQGGGESLGAETIGTGAHIVFSDMPDVVLPDKANAG